MVGDVVETAPAKLNLALHVTGRRADGYHELHSLVAFADLGDELVARRAGHDRLTLSGPFASALKSGETNLVQRAIEAFRARWPGAVEGGVAITLTKNLPVAAGLGGGSADAAAALRIMAALSPAPPETSELAELGATLGADVPMCLLSRPCEVTGTGEMVAPLAAFPQLHAVLVNPLQPVITAEVFRRLEQRDNGGLPPLPDRLDRAALLMLWLEATRNDLEPPAMAMLPVIGELIGGVRAMTGCALSRMSGSGATVFGLFGSSAQAHQAAHELRQLWPGYWVAAAPLITPHSEF